MKHEIFLAFYLGRKEDNANTTLLDRLICSVTKSKYSHVEVVINFNKDGLSECWSSSSRDGGVRRTLIDLNNGHWEVYTLKNFKFDPKEVISFFESQEGLSYDWLGVLTVKFAWLRWLRNIDSKWFCSEISGAALAVENYEYLHPGGLFDFFARKNMQQYLTN